MEEKNTINDTILSCQCFENHTFIFPDVYKSSYIVWNVGMVPKLRKQPISHKDGRGYTIWCQSTKRWLRSNIGFKVLQIAQTFSCACTDVHRFCSSSVHLTWAVPRQPYQSRWGQFVVRFYQPPKHLASEAFRSLLGWMMGRVPAEVLWQEVEACLHKSYRWRAAISGENKRRILTAPSISHLCFTLPRFALYWRMLFLSLSRAARFSPQREREREAMRRRIADKTPPPKNFREGKLSVVLLFRHFSRKESISWVLFCCCCCCCLPFTLDRILVLSLA